MTINCLDVIFLLFWVNLHLNKKDFVFFGGGLNNQCAISIELDNMLKFVWLSFLTIRIIIEFSNLKGFFRRSIKERAPERYRCMEKGNCEISAATRNMCRYCRFQRCIKTGMSAQSQRFSNYLFIAIKVNNLYSNLIK